MQPIWYVSQFSLIIYILAHRVTTDHNEDKTTTILSDWLVKVQNLYHYVAWRPKDEPRLVIFFVIYFLANEFLKDNKSNAMSVADGSQKKTVQSTGRMLVMSTL